MTGAEALGRERREKGLGFHLPEYAPNDLLNGFSPAAIERAMAEEQQPLGASSSETPEEMERRLRREIEMEMRMEKQRSTEEHREETSDWCLPTPVSGVCGANIVFAVLWLMTASLAGIAYRRTLPKTPHPRGKPHACKRD